MDRTLNSRNKDSNLAIPTKLGTRNFVRLLSIPNAKTWLESKSLPLFARFGFNEN